MLLSICLAVIIIGLMPSVFLIGQLSAVVVMARYYGKPPPNWTAAIGLLQAARRGEQADGDS